MEEKTFENNQIYDGKTKYQINEAIHQYKRLAIILGILSIIFAFAYIWSYKYMKYLNNHKTDICVGFAISIFIPLGILYSVGWENPRFNTIFSPIIPIGMITMLAYFWPNAKVWITIFVLIGFIIVVLIVVGLIIRRRLKILKIKNEFVQSLDFYHYYNLIFKELTNYQYQLTSLSNSFDVEPINFLPEKGLTITDEVLNFSCNGVNYSYGTMTNTYEVKPKIAIFNQQVTLLFETFEVLKWNDSIGRIKAINFKGQAVNIDMAEIICKKIKSDLDFLLYTLTWVDGFEFFEYLKSKYLSILLNIFIKNSIKLNNLFYN